MKTTRCFLLLSLALVQAACNAAESDSFETVGPVTGDLQLASRTPERIAGTYRREGVSLNFESVAGASEARLELRKADGSRILQAERQPSGLKLTLFGRQVTGDGATTEGGASAIQAYEALAQSPEFALIGRVAVDLENQGVKAPEFPAAELVQKIGQEFRPLVGGGSGQALSREEGPGSNNTGGVCIEHVCTVSERWNEEACRCEEYNPPQVTWRPTVSRAYKSGFDLWEGNRLDHTYFCLDGDQSCHTIRGWGVSSDKSGGQAIPNTDYQKTRKQECLAASRASNNPLDPCGLLSELYGLNGVCHQHTSRGQLSMHGKFLNPDSILGGRWSYYAYGAYGTNVGVCWAQSNLVCVLQ